GAGFALATLGGYLLSVWIGLFGFKEIRTTAGIVAGVVEVAAFAALAVLAVGPGPPGRPARQAAGVSRRLSSPPAPIPGAGRLRVAGRSAPAWGWGGCGGGAAGARAPAPASGTLRTAKVGAVTVLTNAQGFTLYWFAPDTSNRSTCYGTCAGYWPPLTGTPT